MPLDLIVAATGCPVPGNFTSVTSASFRPRMRTVAVAPALTPRGAISVTRAASFPASFFSCAVTSDAPGVSRMKRSPIRFIVCAEKETGRQAGRLHHKT